MTESPATDTIKQQARKGLSRGPTVGEVVKYNNLCYTLPMKCEWHNCENELSGRARRFCSPACKNKYHVVKNRKQNKQRLIDMMGGKCVECGYDKSPAALTFHHPDDNKEFGIASKGHTKAFDKLVAEASKCVLLCANCHAEEHEKLDGNIKFSV